jgi:hypothetical protein
MMSNTVVRDPVTEPVSESFIAAELEAYNQAFLELELSWRWDARTYRELVQVAADQDFVGAYIERNHAHLLRAYDKSFLRDLVLSAKDRHQRRSS